MLPNFESRMPVQCKMKLKETRTTEIEAGWGKHREEKGIP